MVHFDACVFPFASSCNCSFFPSLIFSVTISVSGTVSSCPVHCFLFFPRCPSFLVCLSLSLPPPRTSPCSWQSGCCWGGGQGGCISSALPILGRNVFLCVFRWLCGIAAQRHSTTENKGALLSLGLPCLSVHLSAAASVNCTGKWGVPNWSCN